MHSSSFDLKKTKITLMKYNLSNEFCVQFVKWYFLMKNGHFISCQSIPYKQWSLIIYPVRVCTRRSVRWLPLDYIVQHFAVALGNSCAHFVTCDSSLCWELPCPLFMGSFISLSLSLAVLVCNMNVNSFPLTLIMGFSRPRVIVKGYYSHLFYL